MLIFFFLLFAEPIEVITLDREFNRVEIYNDKIYLAPFIGGSIFELTTSRDLIPITFTDDVNYRIYDFCITPFTVYLNNGTSIEKFYFAQAQKENVYSSTDISSFIITSSDEVVFANREKHELVFLDFVNSVKFIKPDLNIKDMRVNNNTIYALTNKGIILCDEFGNIYEEKNLPENFNRIFVDSATIFLFSHNKKYFYKINRVSQKFDFPYGISDICGNDELIVILDGSGTNLHIYNKSQIK